jgi:acyl carrier protein
MTQEQAFTEVVGILSPYAKNKAALAQIGPTTDILKDLQVNSARLVDIILGIEDAFDIEVGDEEADEVVTVGDAVALIVKKHS